MSAKRKSSHVSRACNQCRRRKSRCDGVKPSCGTCSVYKDQCDWAEEEDRRRPASKEYVEALRNRVRALEALLDARAEQNGSHWANQDGFLLASSSETNIAVDAEDDDPLDGAMSRLVFDEASGELVQYGETSAMFHASRLSGSPSADSMLPPLLFDEPVIESSEGIDFSRHLPAGTNLTWQQHDWLLDHFFCFFASWTMRADRHLFYRDLRRSCTASDATLLSHYSPLLHNAALAVATAYSDDPQISSAATRAAYGARAKDAAESERKRPTLATVLGLALLSSFYSGRAEHGLGWLHFGTATRLCQTLGLNIDCSALVRAGQLPESRAKERVACFWSLFSQDKAWSCWIGRQASLMTQDLTTELPKVDTAADQRPSLRSADSSSILAQPGLQSSAFVATSTLSLLCARIMAVNYGLASKKIKEVEPLIAGILLQLDDWLARLPATLALPTQTTAKGAPPAVLMLHLAYHWLILLAQRPTAMAKVGSDPGNDHARSIAIKRCERSANRIILLWNLWRRLYGVRFTSITAVQICFTAGSTQVQLASMAPEAALRRREEALAQVRQAVDILREMSASWQSASQCAEILQGLVDAMPSAPYSATDASGAAPVPETTIPTELLPRSPVDATYVGEPNAYIDPSLGSYSYDMSFSPDMRPASLDSYADRQFFDPMLGGMGLTGVDGTFGSHRLARDQDICTSDLSLSVSVPLGVSGFGYSAPDFSTWLPT